MVMTGVSESGGYTLGTTISVTSLAAVTAAGITVANNPFAIKQITEFYNEAGAGATLFLMLVANTMTVDLMASNTNANGCVKLLNYAIAQGTPIKVLGLITDDTVVTTTVTNGINGAVYTAAANIVTTRAAFFAIQAPFRCIIGGTSYSGTASALTTENSGTTNNSAAILIGDTSTTYSNVGAAVGLCLGLISTLPVQRKISRVKNGILTNSTAYLGAAAFAQANGTIIAGKGYITFEAYPSNAGFYFSGDPMLTVSTDDYCFLCRGRVIDKAQVLAYTLFLQEVDDEILTNPLTGVIDPGFAASLQTKIEDAINENMTALGNITGVQCFIDPTQNIVETNTLAVNLNIDAVGYASAININLGFSL
jgi:hypothetical protein